MSTVSAHKPVNNPVDENRSRAVPLAVCHISDRWGVGVCQDLVGRRILRRESRQASAGAGARGKDQPIRSPRQTGAVGHHGLDRPRDVTSARCGAVANPDVHLILGTRDRESVMIRRKAGASIGAEIVGQA